MSGSWFDGIGSALGGAADWAGRNANWLAPLAQAGGQVYSYTQQQNANRAQQQATQQGMAAQQGATQQSLAAQQQAAQQQLAFQQQAYNDSRADLAPYRQAGGNALAQFAAEANTPFGQSPGYQFRFNEGQRAVQSGAAARGSLNSGRTLQALTNYGQGAASAEYGNYMGRLGQLAGIGQGATNQGVTLNANYAGNSGSILGNQANAMTGLYGGQANALTTLYGQQGQAQAAGAMQGANALNTGVNNLFDYWQRGGGK